MTDEAFIAAFESCAIQKAEWTHRAHLRMAWVLITRLSPEEALDRIRTGIQRLNASHGVVGGYHETVTRAYFEIIRRRRTAATFDEFCESNPDLLDRADPPTLRHYRRETIMSKEARERFLEPDLLPFP